MIFVKVPNPYKYHAACFEDFTWYVVADNLFCLLKVRYLPIAAFLYKTSEGKIING
jgi:hypothetical protein